MNVCSVLALGSGGPLISWVGLFLPGYQEHDGKIESEIRARNKV